MSAQGHNTAKQSILVVDDEARIADTLVLILQSRGYSAIAAYGGTTGLEKCRELRPILVITDVVMPDLNGVEMAIEIQKELSGCRILLFSGNASTADILERAGQRGHYFELLAKPVHPNVLIEKVMALIGPGEIPPQQDTL